MEILTIVLFGLVFAAQIATFLKAKGGRKIARGSILLDTSAIMDGRIVDVAATGILTAEMIIPRSVIREMQLLADKSDNDKRARARAGLENIKKLQRLETVAVTIINDGYATEGVDERLLTLAEKYNSSIATVDFNLNKVAKTMDIVVINVNELAQVLRMNYLPGERLEIQLTQTGQNRDQAVGYLDDGTMVVVAEAKNLIGRKVKVEVVRALQTEAGRMMFAKKVAGQPSNQSSQPGQSTPNSSSSHNSSASQKKTQRKTYRGKRRARTPEDSLIAANR
ncbi:MAG: TRAM domain-containing protein [Candidatus Nomurabacteria bacterium]|jgi:uncharacterized protein YacL|nr:TRAM domain-containing protein [Candidatus Nomurabacteria bacterium]